MVAVELELYCHDIPACELGDAAWTEMGRQATRVCSRQQAVACSLSRCRRSLVHSETFRHNRRQELVWTGAQESSDGTTGLRFCNVSR